MHIHVHCHLIAFWQNTRVTTCSCSGHVAIFCSTAWNCCHSLTFTTALSCRELPGSTAVHFFPVFLLLSLDKVEQCLGSGCLAVGSESEICEAGQRWLRHDMLAGLLMSSECWVLSGSLSCCPRSCWGVCGLILSLLAAQNVWSSCVGLLSTTMTVQVVHK